MEVIDVLEKLESDREYKAWKSKNPEFYLAHLFRMYDKENDGVWQVGFYSKKKDRMTTFHVTDSISQIVPEAEIFKKENAEVLELSRKDIKIDIGDAIRKAEELKEKKYKGQLPMKMFAILQNIECMGPVYNITYINQTFTTLNIKVSSADGKVLQHKLTPLMDFKAK